MKQHYIMPVGEDDFKRVREEYYYVDKTGFIKELIDGHAKSVLITRPRRFGKTMAMSMLYYFFALKDAEANRALFEGCIIEKAGERYMAEQGSRPVVFLSLKDIKERYFSGMLAGFGELSKRTYYDFRYLLEGDTLLPGEKAIFESILNKKADPSDLQYSLSNLVDYLARYHGKKVLVLIDEYDAPIQSAWDHGYYGEAIEFVRNYLSSVLKSNPRLDFAVLTGVLRIAKESIFSSLNNLDVASVASGGYADAMGFTYEEIEQMAADFGAQEKLPEIKVWYDGYNFSGREIYNPWSVVNYFRRQFKPAAYWVNTSGNGILKHLLQNSTPAQSKALVKLLRGESIVTGLDEGVIYDEIGQKSDALYTMLLTTGYLTMVDYPDPYEDDYHCTMRIPNREIRTLYKREVMQYLDSIGSDAEMLRELIDNLLTGNAENFGEVLGKFLYLMASCYDTGERESFYHGLVLGLLAALMPRYEVLSNRESGYGRFDIAVFPTRGQSVGALLEFKVAEREADMPERAKEALAQIQENAYLAEFESRGVQEVWQYGIAFWGKKCLIEKAPIA